MRNKPTIVKILLIVVATMGATIYKWIDERGVTQYSDTPVKNSKSQRIEIEPEQPSAASGQGAPAATDSWQEKADAFRQRHQVRQQRLETDVKAQQARQRREAEQAAIERGEHTPVAGKTFATPPLQKDVVSILFMHDSTEDSDCARRRILGAELIERSRRPIQYVERWTLDRCGQPIHYRVTLTPSPQGGTDIQVHRD